MNVATYGLCFRGYGYCGYRSIRIAFTALAVLVMGMGMTACISGRPAPVADTRYDLGVNLTPSSAGSLPPVKVSDAVAPSSLDSDNIVYRIGDQQVAHYANSHWTMPPARLFTQSLRNALALGKPVLSDGDTVNAPVLKTELDEFEQRFDSATVSEGVVSVRATLLYDGHMVSQHTFTVTEPAASPDAAGGAQALARAASKVTSQIAAWLSD